MLLPAVSSKYGTDTNTPILSLSISCLSLVSLVSLMVRLPSTDHFKIVKIFLPAICRFIGCIFSFSILTNHVPAFLGKIRVNWSSQTSRLNTDRDVMRNMNEVQKTKNYRSYTAPSKAQAQIEVLKISIFYSDKDVATPRKHN